MDVGGGDPACDLAVLAALLSSATVCPPSPSSTHTHVREHTGSDGEAGKARREVRERGASYLAVAAAVT